MSPIISFYKGLSPDVEGRLLSEIRAWDFKRLEKVHNYIQWVFPLPERSNSNSDAPLLDQATILSFRSDPALQKEMLVSLDHMLRFYGYVRNDISITTSSIWLERKPSWLTSENHNFLRITRILRCLSLLGLQAHANALLGAILSSLESEDYKIIGDVTLSYWKAAVLSESIPLEAVTVAETDTSTTIAVYEQTSEFHRYFTDWRNRILARFFVTESALIISAGWMWKELPSLQVLAALPLWVSALASLAFFAMDTRNQALTAACENSGRNLERLLGRNGYYCEFMAIKPAKITYTRILKYIYLGTCAILASLAMVASIYSSYMLWHMFK